MVQWQMGLWIVKIKLTITVKYYILQYKYPAFRFSRCLIPCHYQCYTVIAIMHLLSSNNCP